MPQTIIRIVAAALGIGGALALTMCGGGEAGMTSTSGCPSGICGPATGTGGTTSGSTTGTGGMVACASSSTCPGTDSECQTRTCVGGQCGVDFKPSGSMIAAQTPGDCQTAACDGNGNVTSMADATDTLDDGLPCTDDVCSGMAPTSPPSAAGKACNAGGGKLCDGMGVCVECLANTDCSTGICQANGCVEAGCVNGVKDGTETAVDCGGPSCNPCDDLLACGVAADCKSKVCTGNVCQPPTCTDGILNGTETKVDCGGGMCPACPTCSDGIKNGTETGVDCGGTCPACMGMCTESWLCTPWDTGTGVPSAAMNAGSRTCADKNNCGTMINKPATTATLPGLDVNYFECNVEPILDRKCSMLGCHGSETGRALRVYARARLRESASVITSTFCAGSQTGAQCTGADSCPCDGGHSQKEWQRNYDAARGFALDNLGAVLPSKSQSDLLLQPKVGGKSHAGIHLFLANDAEYTTILNWLNGSTLATCNVGNN